MSAKAEPRRPFWLRVTRKLKRRARELTARLTTVRFSLTNHLSRKRIVDDSSDVVLSLTSHGPRVDRVHYTIESIAAGSSLPARLILWLDEPARVENPSPELRRLQRRGLEVRFTDNLGPHTKYYPSLSVLQERDYLVTADDDILYPRRWLSRLRAAARTRPGDVHCMRAHVVGMLDDDVAPYGSWAECWGEGGHPRVFATGVSGVIYPPRMTRALADRGTAFLAVTPKADDIWLHAVAVEEGIPVWQVAYAAEHYAATPSTQHLGLMHDNVHAARNDVQIRATYSSAVLEKLRADE